MDKEIRLNKFLAERLGISRREADNRIAAGRVKIADATAKLGARVKFDDKVFCDGKLVDVTVDYIYLGLNKPMGYVCSRKSQSGAPTVYELLPSEYKNLKTVGRLDQDSSGLILLTNDGDFAYKMTHPSFVKTKLYTVELDRPLSPLHQQMIGDFGIDLPDGKSQLGLERIDDTRKKWRVEMHEGRNRQIRRTFGALGYTVVALHRVQFGPYKLDGLEEGEYCLVKKV